MRYIVVVLLGMYQHLVLCTSCYIYPKLFALNWVHVYTCCGKWAMIVWTTAPYECLSCNHYQLIEPLK